MTNLKGRPKRQGRRRLAASKRVNRVKKRSAKPIDAIRGVLVDDSFWEVDQIIGRKVEKSQIYFLVRWKGCTPSQDSWEPVENLCDSAYEEAQMFEEMENEKKNNNKKDKQVITDQNQSLKTNEISDGDGQITTKNPNSETTLVAAAAAATSSKSSGRKKSMATSASNYKLSTGSEVLSTVDTVSRVGNNKNIKSLENSLETNAKDLDGSSNTTSSAETTSEQGTKDQDTVMSSPVMDSAISLIKAPFHDKSVEGTSMKKSTSDSVPSNEDTDKLVTSVATQAHSDPVDVDKPDEKKLSSPTTESMSTPTVVANIKQPTATKRKKISRKSVLPVDDDECSQQSVSKSRKRLLSAKSIVEKAQDTSKMKSSDMRLNAVVEMSTA
jgi:hypothetical protein